jgi:hypothetical protein
MFIHNRLTVLGASEPLDKFEATDWLDRLSGQHSEIYENSATRRTWWFQTGQPVHSSLVSLSRTWPQLTFLLEFNDEDEREFGVAKVTQGGMDFCQLTY